MTIDAQRFGIIVAIALITYLTRWAGLRLGARSLPPVVDRFLAYVPIAVFATLIGPGITSGEGHLASRLVGAVLAVIVLRSRPLWAGLLAGMTGFWLVEVVIVAAA